MRPKLTTTKDRDMPLVKCKNCVFAVAPEFEPSGHRCLKKCASPDAAATESTKAYWKIIDIHTDACGDGELKPSKK
jgi:hypothetical protein